jgi:Nif-specific regulatory protein
MSPTDSPDQYDSCTLLFAYKEIELLYEIAVLLSSSDNVKESIEKGMRMLKHGNYLDRCALFLLDESQRNLELFASIDLTPQQQSRAVYEIGEGATGLAAQSAEPIVIENIHNDINYLNKMGSLDTSVISYVAVPIIQQDGVVGVVSANLREEIPLQFDDIVRMLTILGSIAIGSILVHRRFNREKEEIQQLKSYYKEELLSDYRFENIIGKSKNMQQIFAMLETVAPSNATILVRGETGTGKELIAAAVHNLSPRSNGPFIKLNCAAISETLLESELFGHEKGAFTDAKETRKGRFELADGGTLFLDEIGDITPALQVKLLRILQEQEFERVGGAKTIKTNVRLVAATNRNLEKMVKAGEFREDLFYRLNVIPVNLPPLRERYEDIQLLIQHYLNRYMKEHHKQMHFSKKAMELLQAYPWPGNIRELQNTMERIVLICPEGELEPAMLNHVLPFNFQKLYLDEPSVVQEPEPDPAPSAPPHEASEQAVGQGTDHSLTKSSLQEMEKQAIIQALIDHHGIQTKAARQLGMTARQIGYKIKKYGIEL